MSLVIIWFVMFDVFGVFFVVRIGLIVSFCEEESKTTTRSFGSRPDVQVVVEKGENGAGRGEAAVGACEINNYS